MERLHLPLTVEEQKVAALPQSVQEYLAQAGIARNEVMPAESRVNAMKKQVDILAEMSPDDRNALCDYVDWKSEQLRKKVVLST